MLDKINIGNNKQYCNCYSCINKGKNNIKKWLNIKDDDEK